MKNGPHVLPFFLLGFAVLLVQMSGETDCTAFPLGDNLFEWAGTITGSVDTAVRSLCNFLRRALDLSSSHAYGFSILRAHHCTFYYSMKTFNLNCLLAFLIIIPMRLPRLDS